MVRNTAERPLQTDGKHRKRTSEAKLSVCLPGCGDWIETDKKDFSRSVGEQFSTFVRFPLAWCVLNSVTAPAIGNERLVGVFECLVGWNCLTERKFAQTRNVFLERYNELFSVKFLDSMPGLV